MPTPRRYAEGTSVAVEKTRAEIESLLKRHGATAFFSASDANTSMIGFHMGARVFRLEIRVAKPEHAPKPKRLFVNSSKVLAQGERWATDENKRRWRAQLLLIKAKLEMIATGESSIEREFLADLMLPNGKTVGQQTLPALASGEMPALPTFASSRRS
jgi:hypothetical protein